MAKKRKLLIIQIDALSYPLLKKMISKGYMPFLKKYLKTGHLQEYNCSLPSSTPCIQSGLLYGDDQIPGFLFVDKKKKTFHTFYSTTSANLISSKFKNKGILNGGSAYSVIFSGGANKTLFVLGHGNKPATMSSKDAIWYSFINPFILIRIISRITTQWFFEIIEFLYYGGARIFSKEYYTPFRPDYWFRRLFFNAFSNTVASTAVRRDLKKGVEKIYINYTGFDDMSHIRGPSTKASLRVLKGIDVQIKRIIKCAKDYDVYIYSDHGMMDSVYFNYKYGMDFSEFLEEICQKEGSDISKNYVKQASFKKSLWSFSSGIAKASVSPIWGMIKPFWIYFRPNAKTQKMKGKDFVVAKSSNAAQIYFLKYPKRLNKKDFESLHPHLIENIVFHPGVGIVLVKEGSRFLAYSKQGTTILPSNDSWMDKFNVTGKDLLNFAKRDNAGDLIVLGNIINGKCIAFEDQAGVHGGCGGDQLKPFIFGPHKMPKINKSSELYGLFKDY